MAQLATLGELGHAPGVAEEAVLPRPTRGAVTGAADLRGQAPPSQQKEETCSQHFDASAKELKTEKCILYLYQNKERRKEIRNIIKLRVRQDSIRFVNFIDEPKKVSVFGRTFLIMLQAFDFSFVDVGS